MAATWDRFLFWTPRALSVLFALFLGVFAADVFSETRGFFSTALALFLHLIPSALVLLILVLARRREGLSGTFALALGVVFLVTSWGRGDWIGIGAISAPLLAIGACFLAHWWLLRRSQLQASASP